MSEQHASRLMKLRREIGAAREAAEGAAAGRLRGTKYSAVAEFNQVAENLEKTYYVRLCAEVEGMLYRHLGDHFAFDGLTDKNGNPLNERERERVAADALLVAVRVRVSPRSSHEIPPEKFKNAREVYAYRNRLAHGNRTRQAPVDMEEAFRRLESLLLELPNMK